MLGLTEASTSSRAEVGSASKVGLFGSAWVGVASSFMATSSEARGAFFNESRKSRNSKHSPSSGSKDPAAVIDGTTVMVSSNSVTQPTAVRFAWHQTAVHNLVNGAGLPASPFRTEAEYGGCRPNQRPANTKIWGSSQTDRHPVELEVRKLQAEELELSPSKEEDAAD